MEEFRIIKWFPNFSVSNFGNVRNNSTGKNLKPTITKNGYYMVILCDEYKTNKFYIHRLVGQTFLNNPEKKKCIDHIDNNRLKNHISNLRFATLQENQYNRKLSSNNTSGAKGVYFHKPFNKWMVLISINGKLKNLGYFEKKEDAIRKRVEKAKEIYGEYMNSCEQIKEDIVEIKDDNQRELDEIEALERELDELIKRK